MATQTGITCTKYVQGDGKRCRHYLPSGACSLASELMCTEWTKRNCRKPVDLFGNPVPDQPAPRPERKAEHAPAPVAGLVQPPDPPAPPPRGLTTEDIESFKALRVAVCFRTDELGDVWLVPAYTGKPRQELTPEHLATLAAMAQAFPGARVISFERDVPAASQDGGVQ